MLSKDGAIKEEAMANTLIWESNDAVVDSSDADKTLEAVEIQETAYVIGEVIAGEKGVTLYKYAVFVSGGGTNLQAIIDNIESGI